MRALGGAAGEGDTISKCRPRDALAQMDEFCGLSVDKRGTGPAEALCVLACDSAIPGCCMGRDLVRVTTAVRQWLASERS